jgi:hypothetical protein
MNFHGKRICRLALLAAWTLAVLGACAPPTAPPAGTAFDGTYAGQATLVSGGPGFICGELAQPLTIVVRSGRFDYPFEFDPPRTTPLPVQIAADGTLNGQMQYGTVDYTPRRDYLTAWATVAGRVSGTTLEATVAGLRCVRRMVVQRG